MRKMNNREIINAMEKQMIMEGKSINTYYRYVAILNKILKYFNNKDLSVLTDVEIKKYLEYMQKNYKESTYNSHVSVLKYIEKKVLKSKKNIDDLFSLVKVPKKELKLPSEEDINIILSKCYDFELECIITIIINTGARLSEIVEMRVRDINQSRKILCFRNKDKKVRYIAVNNKVIKKLNRYINNYRKNSVNNYLFSRENNLGHIKTDYVGRELKKLQISLGIYDYTVQQFRRYYELKKDVLKHL